MLLLAVTYTVVGVAATVGFTLWARREDGRTGKALALGALVGLIWPLFGFGLSVPVILGPPFPEILAQSTKSRSRRG